MTINIRLIDKKTPETNNTNPKVTVNWLNEALYLLSRFLHDDREVLRNTAFW
jgi:hypothetical protein